MRILEKKGLKISCEVICEQRFQLVFEEAFEFVAVQIHVHCVPNAVIHFEVWRHFKGLHIDTLADPHDLFGLAYSCTDRMSKIFGDLVLTEAKTVLLCT